MRRQSAVQAQHYGKKHPNTKDGPVIRMIGAPQLERFFPPEQVFCLPVLDASTGKLYKDDPQSSILVLGDSFLRMYQIRGTSLGLRFI